MPKRRFRPDQAKAILRISGTDYFDHLTLPWLIPFLQSNAPGVKLVTATVKERSPRDDLERGHCDLAIAGFFSKLPQEFFRQKLFDEDFVCVVRKGHSKLRKGLNLDRYLELRHILISPQGDLDGVVDQAVVPLGRKRTVVAGIANFSSPGKVVATSDLILTCPRRLAHYYQEYLPVDLHEVPLELAGFQMAQVWHQRTHQDPLHRWVRGLIKDYCENYL